MPPFFVLPVLRCAHPHTLSIQLTSLCKCPRKSVEQLCIVSLDHPNNHTWRQAWRHSDRGALAFHSSSQRPLYSNTRLDLTLSPNPVASAFFLILIFPFDILPIGRWSGGTIVQTQAVGGDWALLLFPTVLHRMSSYQGLTLQHLTSAGDEQDILDTHSHSSPVINAPLTLPSCNFTMFVTLPPVRSLCTLYSIFASRYLVLNAGPANFSPKNRVLPPQVWLSCLSLATSQSSISQGYLL
ncbi:hypothetical protein EDB92DRAFT_600845 [Lactarius akahatsu]|uniref:Uncharacterized protein n=1 Tax=Lactarius akahatsu TaxID=416441 RepID=A0AAD4Q503_9AGAM|nr:hypothetical protein EDB92DRAFT_600845 [Lactarius akahatsu]